ncbi:lytic transglycosylase [Streptomyces pactum]|uniref:Lytic transglycosylase n=1 Tax=Streptomyces pactum TaxID=68249 RepID=A0ABS0NGK6_9ACTN|nr:lytic transglycosylase [Streptomyces pactum]MBH5334327.1 lytic transglycosylase [Streptomyces pactum]
MAAHYGRRLRKRAATTAVAAVAMAALTASQAPGFAGTPNREREAAGGSGASAPPGTPIDGGSPYHTDLPPLVRPDRPDASADLPGGPGDSPGRGPLIATGPAERGIPATVLDAYKRAEASLRESNPGCNLPWQLLAAIGKVESGQARGGAVDADGTTFTPILGPQLNGVGFANITDTDGGAYDGDTTHDRAVGPMQFIPSTWAGWGRDGNGDGVRNPNNIYDAALAAGSYLCAGGRDLSDPADLDRAILGYNPSREYLRTVLSWFEYYKTGTHEVPDGAGTPSRRDPADAGEGRNPGKPGGTSDKPGKKPDKNEGNEGKPGKPDRPEPPAGGSGGGDKPAPEPTRSPSPRGARPGVRPGGRRGDHLTAEAGEEFALSPRVRARTATGKPVSGVAVRYEIVGETDTRFAGNVRRAVVVTGEDGVAVAPRLRAGERTGEFTVRATAPGRNLPAVDFASTVTAPPVPGADTLARTDTEVLRATAGAEFTAPLSVLATAEGRPVAGVPVTATMITSDAVNPAQNTAGPYFKGADGNPLRVLEGLKTDAQGRLTLPQIFADDQTGTFRLRLTTADGTVLVVDLLVTAPTAG